MGPPFDGRGWPQIATDCQMDWPWDGPGMALGWPIALGWPLMAIECDGSTLMALIIFFEQAVAQEQLLLGAVKAAEADAVILMKQRHVLMSRGICVTVQAAAAAVGAEAGGV